MCPSSQPTANIALSTREDESIKEIYQLAFTLLLEVFATVWEINSSLHTWGVFQCVDLSLPHLDGDNVHPVLCIEDKEPSSHRTNSDEQSTTVHGQRRGRFLGGKKITHIYRLTAFASVLDQCFVHRQFLNAPLPIAWHCDLSDVTYRYTLKTYMPYI